MISKSKLRRVEINPNQDKLEIKISKGKDNEKH